MTALRDIPITVEESAPNLPTSGNSMPILHEVLHSLRRLAGNGETTRIDLNAIPFGPDDEEHLLTLLGRGEVQATVDALGMTRVTETAFAGVWLVDYLNEQNQRLTLHLEITEIPSILRVQPRDIEDTITALDAHLSADPSAPQSES